MQSPTLRRIAIIVMVLTFLGILNASYVTYLTFWVIPDLTHPLLCDISAIFACSTALASGATRIFGIPSCTIAIFVYPIIAFCAWLAYTTRWQHAWKTIATLGGLGVLMNLFIIYRETVMIHAYCLLCLICGLIVLTICGLGIYGTRASR